MNVSGLLDLFDQLPAFQTLLRDLEENKAVDPLTLPTAARAAVLANLFQQQKRPIFLLTGRVDAVSPWVQALQAWLPSGSEVLRLPEPTPLPFDRGPWARRAREGRLTTLAKLMAGQHPLLPKSERPFIIVASARAFLQKTLPKRRFMGATRVLRVGQRLDLEATIRGWTDIGYEPVQVVEAAGQFSRRGGIIDIYPLATLYPVRIELFGDEIDTLRYFDPATQRTVDVEGETAVSRLLITPAREALPGVARDFAVALEDEISERQEDLPSWQDDVPKLLDGTAFPNLEYYIPLIYPEAASLLGYLPKEALLVIDDWFDLAQASRELHEQAEQIASEQESLPPGMSSPLFGWEDMASELTWWQPLMLGEGNSDPDDPLPLSPLAECFQPGPRYGGQMRPLMTQLKQTRQEGERVVVASRQAMRLLSLWQDELKGRNDPQNKSSILLPEQNKSTTLLVNEIVSPLAAGDLRFLNGTLAEGFVLSRPEDNEILLDLLTDAEVFGWKRPIPRRTRAARPAAPESNFADIAAGDYVVHIEYGIGQFEGLVVRLIGGMEREYLLVRYANSDTLYVPAHQADRLAKWIGPTERDPAIHRLGEKGWNSTKQQAQKAADELAQELIELYAKRETVPGHAFAPDNDWQLELEASFPHRETEDQLRVIAEVKADMEAAHPMDRLVCGDVGYGKTEVALRAAFKAVNDGKQVAVLVPTTILAQQHFETFRDRLSPFPVKVEMLSRFRTATQQANIVKEVREGTVDIIIGTHRLLSDDVSFKDLGLFIIDEEQRFGVSHKEQLKRFRTEVDVLAMTATPIPRTLYMSISGVRDISIIQTAPAERLPVQTYVGEADETRLKRAIQRELDRGGQVFIVHNRVQTIGIIQKQIEQLVPEAIIEVGHGQMSERTLEKIMNRFASGGIDILLATTIIESGLDFPNANTLIVDRAEMFGLSQLYQLRGRVGRSARRAYAYFFHARRRGLTDEAKARLDTIAEQTQLGAGYQVAMRDMEIRGAGDLLGDQQSGQISAVGFDLYTRMLATAVKRLKAEQKGEELPVGIPEATLIDLPLAAYVPQDYVPDAGLRLRLYRRMATLETLEETDGMAAELTDRFGAIPDPIDNLLYQIRVKALAQQARVAAITTDNSQIRIRINDLENLSRFQLQRFLGENVRVSKTAVWLKREMATNEWKVELVQVLERLQAYVTQMMKKLREESASD